MNFLVWLFFASTFVLLQLCSTGTRKGWNICSNLQVDAVAYDPIAVAQVLIFAKDYYWTYSLLDSALSKANTRKEVWPEISETLAVADSRYLDQMNGTHRYLLAFFSNEGRQWFYTCRHVITNCTLAEPVISNSTNRTQSTFRAFSGYFYQVEMAKRNASYTWHFYGENPKEQYDCSFNTHASGNCDNNLDQDFSNLNKLNRPKDALIRGISAYHWQSPNITDFFVVGTSTVRYTFLNELKEISIGDFFGCFSLRRTFIYVALAITGVLLVAALVFLYMQVHIRSTLATVAPLACASNISVRSIQVIAKKTPPKQKNSTVQMKGKGHHAAKE